jgi:hypothetical protein
MSRITVEVHEAIHQTRIITVEAASPLEAFAKIEAGEYLVKDVTPGFTREPEIRDMKMLDEMKLAVRELSLVLGRGCPQ